VYDVMPLPDWFVILYSVLSKVDRSLLPNDSQYIFVSYLAANLRTIATNFGGRGVSDSTAGLPAWKIRLHQFRSTAIFDAKSEKERFIDCIRSRRLL
jgi:hypothetical protein